MKKNAVVWKKIGETPLQALEKFRVGKSEIKNTPLTYAGRLDPMAEGKLLLLIGEECKRKDEYNNLDKEYEFEVLFGVSTDTGDVLGIPQICDEIPSISEEKIKKEIASHVGNHTLSYPAFSSKNVSGKPLFQYAHENKLGEIEIPTKDIEIYKISFCEIKNIPSKDVLENILARISLLETNPDDSRAGSDFRKDEIQEKWKNLLQEKDKNYWIAKFKITASSGTYIRVLAPKIAKGLGSCGLAYAIRRTKIGHYIKFTKHFGIWRKTF